ncbi:helix-turn-helix domain-containing protein [Vibrio anguillarum]|uniref:helix-turn-helix domain-containing protein n=1 Tax=Vibrio anguillarum TaxID=55601 RepID=UPI001C03C4B5|nr:helix-turn-helix domain-containing protein [Vibrio anguillarum]MBT2925301.1 helix-turn-helix domain-containing protein [Vibrio anguillarum]
MSRAANDWAWSLDIKPASLKLLLLSMADRADEDHCCFPSIVRLEKDTGLNRKTILSGIKKLIDCGVLKDTGEKRGRTMRVIVYKLVGVESGITKLDARTPRKPVEEIDPKTEQYQEWNDSENGTLNRPENGTQNQSLEPVIEPSKDLVPSKLETDDPILFEIPLKGKTQSHAVTQSKLFELREQYPAVDVTQQIKNMIGWCTRHPNKQKTKRGVMDFVHNWLSKEQDKFRPAQPIESKSVDAQMKSVIDSRVWQIQLEINNEQQALERFKRHGASEQAVKYCHDKIAKLSAELSELGR